MTTLVILISALLTQTLATTSALAQPARDITYNPRAVVRIDTKLRMTTLVVLPDTEEILDFVCGDKDYWIISRAQNLAYIKPAKEKATTNLNLVTASGHVYSFLLVEGSARPDLKVFVLPDPATAASTRALGARSATLELEALKTELADAKAESQKANANADDTKRNAARLAQDGIDRFKATYPTELQFPYVFKSRRKPFNVTAIFHDDRFTYIRAEGRELPSLYEVVDHVPNLISYQVERGTFIVPKVVDHGYLAIGKKRLAFDVPER
jgi:type IV secretory pathway VirB9-like protein